MYKLLAPSITLAWLLCFPIASPSWGQQNVVVVLDDSGSMDARMRTATGRVRRIDAAKKALTNVLSQLPPETRVGVLALNTRVDGSHWVVPFGPADPKRWQANIQQIRAKGGTPLGEFLKRGADQLLEARGRQVYGTYRLLVVTDGEANDSHLVDAYLPDILSRGLVTDVIGVDMQSDHSLATRVHQYRRADDDASLQQAISEVFAETSPDDQLAAQDFELLAALPDEMAAEALQALVQRGNAPIEGDANAAPFRDASMAAQGNATGSSVGVAFGGLFCCFAGVVLVAAVVVGILLSVRKPPRRRR